MQKKEFVIQIQNEQFKLAARKFFDNKNLLCNDMKALLREISVKGDSPIKKKADEMRVQLQNRKQRLEKYNCFLPKTTLPVVPTIAPVAINDNVALPPSTPQQVHNPNYPIWDDVTDDFLMNNTFANRTYDDNDININAAGFNMSDHSVDDSDTNSNFMALSLLAGICCDNEIVINDDNSGTDDIEVEYPI
jgi:hypothetical protein